MDGVRIYKGAREKMSHQVGRKELKLLGNVDGVKL